MILNGIGNSSECIITKLLNFIIPKCQFWHEPHLYLYSLKISSLIVVRNSTRYFSIREIVQSSTFGSYLLALQLLVRSLKQQVPASGQQLSECISIAKHFRFITFPLGFSFLDFPVLILHYLPAISDPKVLYSFINQL